MATPTADAPPSFNWTDEEKGLLRRTLKVRKLLDDELEIEAIEGGLLHGHVWLLATTVLTVVLVSWLVFTGTTIDSRGLRTPTVLVAILPPLVWLWLIGGFASGRTNAGHPVSLFPATPWFVRHRPVASRLERLSPSDRESSQIDRVLFATDIDTLLLRARAGMHEADLIRVRQLIVERCAVRSPHQDNPPERVVGPSGVNPTQPPRPFYVLLARYLDVQSASADTLVLEHPSPPDRRSKLVMLGGLVIVLGLPLVGVAVWGWNDHLYLGDFSSARMWRTALIAVPILLAFLQLALSARLRKRPRHDTIALSKDLSYLMLRTWRGAEQCVPINECLLLIAPDASAAESDVGSIPKSVVIRHGKRDLAWWPLTHPRPSDEEERTLRWGLHEYWSSAARKAASEPEAERRRHGKASQSR